jgi:hypothetical protein
MLGEVDLAGLLTEPHVAAAAARVTPNDVVAAAFRLRTQPPPKRDDRRHQPE